jgi:hypothetical protein
MVTFVVAEEHAPSFLFVHLPKRELKKLDYICVSHRWTPGDHNWRGVAFPSRSQQQDIRWQEAVKAALALECRYVWWDLLCIDDSEDEVCTAAGSMGSIYQDCVATIVTSVSSRASCLPSLCNYLEMGYESGKKSADWYRQLMGSEWASYDINTLTGFILQLAHALDCGGWSKRLWTCQEAVLPPECYINAERGIGFRLMDVRVVAYAVQQWLDVLVRNDLDTNCIGDDSCVVEMWELGRKLQGRITLLELPHGSKFRPMSLAEVCKATRRMECERPVDQWNAMLGLLGQTQPVTSVEKGFRLYSPPTTTGILDIDRPVDGYRFRFCPGRVWPASGTTSNTTDVLINGETATRGVFRCGRIEFLESMSFDDIHCWFLRGIKLVGWIIGTCAAYSMEHDLVLGPGIRADFTEALQWVLAHRLELQHWDCRWPSGWAVYFGPYYVDMQNRGGCVVIGPSDAVGAVAAGCFPVEPDRNDAVVYSNMDYNNWHGDYAGGCLILGNKGRMAQRMGYEVHFR